MQIDCRGLECPKPIIKTRDALNELSIGDKLEIVVNSPASLANVQKFLSANGLEFNISQNGSEYTVTAVKSCDLTEIDIQNYSCETDFKKHKVLFLKYDKVGSDPIGKGLLTKFLSAISAVQANKRVTHIICVNEAVLMTTNRSHPSFAVLKDLSSLGINVLSCGSCLESFGLVDRLGVGQISNAFEIMSLMLENETVYL
ncbi:TPA: sulfurtransferase-like selenium metabolism protein YedF [Campylobacter fetus subsp. venerealis]|uniref:Selenium metabolism protein n=1 Tax=Campylobacter fetus subsp. venerealis NCTC 10354 TaxID=983328 RepID=A0AAE6M9D1_CAMFE|nr:sulfurtransferase-like selenium metabolism protein YedF [Campylobacter fetus]OCS27233.1 hypothetical protein CFVB10_00740 [Campylobacter fetus subsp. venerealis cfvB10]OCS30338.1 hypothetical protein CFVCCUG33900_02285 [Campylobacter fetus subsp. venerealis LMG 6570 = CCUG 33900]AIR80006.1 selenium metabolism protein [Campylobacter fetus subsp. venerealis 97/608]EAK0834551.1 sulfurtransferase-like selenium metabolism protein YedF [Campylobacter fetus]EGU23502.1 hypothetical protein CFV354_0